MALQPGKWSGYVPQDLSQGDRQQLWEHWGHSGEAPVGFGGESGGGGESIDLSQVPSVEGYIKGQFPSEDVALNQLIMTQRAQPKPLEVYTGLEQAAGLPELRQTSSSLSKEIANIEDYLYQIEPNVSARTKESLVTEAQRKGMVAAERKPWAENLVRVSTALGRVRQSISEGLQDIATKTGLVMKGAELELKPLELQYSTLVDRHQRLTSGFSTDRQTKLDILFDKLKRERQLSDREWELANELAKEERTYTRGLQETAASAGVQNVSGLSSDDLLSEIGWEAYLKALYDRS